MSKKADKGQNKKSQKVDNQKVDNKNGSKKAAEQVTKTGSRNSKRREQIKKITDNKTSRLTKKELKNLSRDELITIILGQNNKLIQVEKYLKKDEAEIGRLYDRIDELKTKKDEVITHNYELLRQIANYSDRKYGRKSSKKSRKSKNEDDDSSNKKSQDPKQEKDPGKPEESKDPKQEGANEPNQEKESDGSENAESPEEDQDKAPFVIHTKHDPARDAKLPVEKRYMKDSGKEYYCPNCGTRMLQVGHKLIKREKEIIPAQTRIVEYYVPVYYCPRCKKGDKNTIIAEKGPIVPLPGTTSTSAMLLAWIIMMKFQFHIPYTRLEVMLQLTGDFRTTESMMSRHIIEVSGTYFKPLVEHLMTTIRNRHIVSSDDTTLKCMREPDKENGSISRMWIFSTITGLPDPIKLCVYSPNRRKENVEYVLGEDYSGVIPCDCYAGYNVLEDATLAFCWIHLKRKFSEAVPEALKKKFDGSICEAVEKKIEKIFAEDHKIQELEDWYLRKEGRERTLKPLIDGFFAWLRKQKTKNSAIQEAIQYALNHEEGFKTCIQDPDIPLGNNESERIAYKVCLGRKNWLFAGSPWGAMAIGNCLSLILTAQANGLDPFLYMCYILTVMPKRRRGDDPYNYSDEELEALMPWQDHVKRYCESTKESGTQTEMCRRITELNGFVYCEDPDAETQRRKARDKQLLSA